MDKIKLKVGDRIVLTKQKHSSTRGSLHLTKSVSSRLPRRQHAKLRQGLRRRVSALGGMATGEAS